MSAPDQSPPADTSRRSQRVAVVFLGAVGVVGGVVAWDAWRHASAAADAQPEQLEPAPSPVAADRTYRNNDFIPGVGYYHAPYRAWFPQPYNFHDPNRGYFGGGLWQAAPFIASMLSSRPTQPAVNSALAAQSAREGETRPRTAPGTANFANSNRSNGGSSFFSPRPSPAPTAPTTARPAAPAPATAKPSAPSPSESSPTIQRGGFGSSGKGSSGAGSS